MPPALYTRTHTRNISDDVKKHLILIDASSIKPMNKLKTNKANDAREAKALSKVMSSNSKADEALAEYIESPTIKNAKAYAKAIGKLYEAELKHYETTKYGGVMY